MSVKSILKKQFFLWLGFIGCIFIIVSSPGAETKNTSVETNQQYAKIKKNFTNPKQFKTIAKVMEVNTDEFYIVIAENMFYVAEFKIDGKIHRTDLTDVSGKSITMDAFAERDLVEVTAIELEPHYKYVALTINILPPR